MLLSDVLAIVFSVLGMLLAFQGLWLLSRGVWPTEVAATAADCQRTLWKPFLAGLPLAAAGVLAIGRLFKIGGPGGACGFALLSIVLIVSSIGVAGLASVVGSRLNGGRNSVKTMVLGGVALEMAFVFPVVGWFVVLPITLVIGLGSAVRAVFLRGKNKAFNQATGDGAAGQAGADQAGTISGAPETAGSVASSGAPK